MCHLTLALVAAVFVAACDSKTPASPTSAPVTSTSSSATEYVLIVRALDADTKAPISGLDVAILDGPRAGNSSSSPSDQLPLSVPNGRVTLRVTAAGHDPAETTVDVSGAALVEVPVKRSATPAPTPSPSPNPPPSFVTISGVVRDASTGRGIPSATVQVIGGADDGRGTSTDGNGTYRLNNLRDSARRLMATAPNYAGISFDVTGNGPVNFDLMPVPQFLYSGTVRDGQGRPVAGVRVEGGGKVSTSDANGHYEFSAVSNSLQASARPPAGYEPKPRNYPPYTFELLPGQDITVRRIVRVSVSGPATIGISSTDFTRMTVSIEFDTGQVESPYWDSFSLGTSDSSVARGRVRDNAAYLEGIKPGMVEVTGHYWGVTSAPYAVQVR